MTEDAGAAEQSSSEEEEVDVSPKVHRLICFYLKKFGNLDTFV